MICKHCGAQIPDDSAFCSNCGNMVENEDVQPRVQSGYCTNCGAPIYEGSTVCETCGQRLDLSYNNANNGYNAYNDTNPQYETRTGMNYAAPNGGNGSSRTTVIVIIAVIVVALAAGTAAFFLFRDNFIPPKEDNSQTTLVKEQKKNEKTPDPAATPAPEKTREPAPTVPPVPTTPPAQSARSEVNTNPGNNEYMYASNIKVLSQSDLSSLTQAETRLLLNEIYARHGYIFQTREYSDYFSRKAWYTPRYTSQSDAESQFNDIELQNKNIISNYEKSKGWR